MKEKKLTTKYLTRRKLLKNGINTGIGICTGELFYFSGCSKRSGKKPNIILIVLDTTRADRLSCYGHYRQTCPNIDALAQGSRLYTKAIATSSWTLPSHASLFTGKYTTSHGAQYHPQGPLYLGDAIGNKRNKMGFRARILSPSELTLASILKNAGYQTAAAVGGPWLKKVFGLAKGFDYYDDTKITTLHGTFAENITNSAVNWINGSYEKKFFLFLNYFDPHAPYAPSESFLNKLVPKGAALPKMKSSHDYETQKWFYDAEILYMDHHIGRLLRYLKKNGLYDDTWIIITADHGELIGEHGKTGHGSFLYQEEIHVPLIFKYPLGEMQPERSDLRIQLIDILPAILHRLGIPLPEGIQGNIPSKLSHPVIAETYPHRGRYGHWRAIFDGNYKFIWNSKGNHQFFDLMNKNGEDTNLIRGDSERSKILLAKLNRYINSLPKPGPPGPAQEIDQKTKETLKSLGYVQ